MKAIAVRRLYAQRLLGKPFGSAVEAVRWLGAVQSQDYGAAKWALAQRTAGATDGSLDRLFNQGAILRTHVMRTTWHFVAPEDVRWLLELTTPRLLAGAAGRHRQLELDQRTLTRATGLFAKALRGGHFLTRPELSEVLLAARISPEGQRLPHLLAYAEGQAVIVSGPRRGKQFTWALLDERARASRRLSREEALAELTRRYFRSHGPAQVKDFAWWSGLSGADIKSGIALAGSSLAPEVLDGKEYWASSDPVAARKPPLMAHLLPNFDEFTVAYRDREAVLHPDLPFDPSHFAYFRESSPQGGVLSNVVTVGGFVRGAWRRTVTARVVRIEITPLGRLTPAERPAIDKATARYGRFLGLQAELRIV